MRALACGDDEFEEEVVAVALASGDRGGEPGLQFGQADRCDVVDGAVGPPFLGDALGFDEMVAV